MLTLIPLYVANKLVNDLKKKRMKDLERKLKERKLTIRKVLTMNTEITSSFME